MSSDSLLESPREEQSRIVSSRCSRSSSHRSRGGRTQGVRCEQRGVSNVIGFVLMFGILSMAVVAGVFFGFSTISELTSEQSLPQAVDSMASYKGDVTDVVTGAPYRQSEVQVTDGSFSFGPEFSVSINASGGGVSVSNYRVTSRTVELQMADSETVVRYTAGLISHRGRSGESILKSPPEFTTSGSRTFISLPNITASPETSTSVGIGGTDTVYILSDQRRSNTLRQVATTPGGDITDLTGDITINGVPNLSAWVSYLENAGYSNVRTLDMDGDGEVETVRADFTSSRLYVSTSLVQTTLSKESAV